MHGLSARTQILEYTYRVLAKGNRMLAFGLGPTSLRSMWFCLENCTSGLSSLHWASQESNSPWRDLVLEICDRVRVTLNFTGFSWIIFIADF